MSDPATPMTSPGWTAASGMDTFFVTPWIVRSPTAVTSMDSPSAGRLPELDGLGEHEGGRRELVGLDALAAELAVAHRLVAPKGRQVGGEVRRGQGRALERDRAREVRGAADGLRAPDAASSSWTR